MASSLDFTTTPRRVLRAVLYVIALLGALGAIAMIVRYGFGHPRAFGFVWMFSVGGEHNVPALFSTSLMFLIAAVAFGIGARAQQNPNNGAKAWLGIGILFVFLGIDESVMLHEQLAAPLREHFGVGGLFHFAWILPYGIAVVMLTIVYLPFVWSLPPRCRRLVIESAAVYLGGALVMEALNGAYYESMTEDGVIAYVLMVYVEEIMEMLGLAMFLRAELEYLVTAFEPVVVRFGRDGPGAALARATEPRGS